MCCACSCAVFCATFVRGAQAMAAEWGGAYRESTFLAHPQACNLQPAACSPQPATRSLQPVTRSLHAREAATAFTRGCHRIH